MHEAPETTSQRAPGRDATTARATTGEPTAVLRVDDLHKRYESGAHALRGVDLTLARGEVLAILGPNGAGKTSLVEILTGFRDATSGEVRLLGLDPGNRADRAKLRRRVGVVLQHTGHYRYLGVRETLAMHHAFHAAARSVDEVLQLVGLDDVADRRVRQLSGGQQRRLDVGVALIGQPDVIFLDEPTTGFDPAARRRLWEVVGELARLGTSVVLTTHYMEEASQLADRVVVLAAGRVAGEGTPEELASTAQLATTIRARLAADASLDGLPDELRAWLAPGPDGGWVFEQVAVDPVPVLAALCGWAQRTGVELTELDVRPPTLEDSYLALTADAAPAGDDLVAGVR